MDVNKVGKSLLRKPKLQTQTTFDSISSKTTSKPVLLSSDDKKKLLYEKECSKLRVTPVGSYLRQVGKRELAIKNYPLGPEGVRALSVPLMVDNTVIKLDLEGNAIGPKGLSYLYEFLLDGLVNCLNLAGNNLGCDGAVLMYKLMTANHFIDTLNLSGNDFVDSDAEFFARIIQENKQLRYLDLSHNSFGGTAAQAFGKVLAQNENLEYLDISWNHIRKEGAVRFCDGIKENIGLKVLNVSFNGFASEGLVAMAEALTNNRSLLELDMSNNRITDDGIPTFSECLRKNESLKLLKIGDNPLTGAAALEMLMAIENGESRLDELDLQSVGVDEYFVKVLETIQERRNFQAKYGRLQRMQWKSKTGAASNTEHVGDDENETDVDPSDGAKYSICNDTFDSRSFDDEDFAVQSEIVTTAVERQSPSLYSNDDEIAKRCTSAPPNIDEDGINVPSPKSLTPHGMERETSKCSLRSDSVNLVSS